MKEPVLVMHVAETVGWAGRRPNLAFVFHVTSFAPVPLRLLLRETGFVPLRIGNSPPTWGDPYGRSAGPSG